MNADYHQGPPDPTLPTGAVRLMPAEWRLQVAFAGATVILPAVGMAIAAWDLYQGTTPPAALAIGAVMYLICVLGASAGFHRHFAHRAFKAHPALRVFLGITGSMAGQGPLVFWVSYHRRHHAYSDQTGDPHSPNLAGAGAWGRLKGLWHGHIGWMFSKTGTDWMRFSADVVRDRLSFWIQRTYLIWLLAGFALPAAAGAALVGGWAGAWQGLLWGGLVRMFILNQSAWAVGSICHLWGYRRFKTGDKSANNPLVAFFTFGEGLQNNHHAFPSSAAHGLYWWEPDFSLAFIRLWAALGLAWDVKHPSDGAIERARLTYRRAPRAATEEIS